MSEHAFEYIGPLPGNTPKDDSDLHTSDNPFERGRPGTATDSSDFPNASPLGYWTNPAVKADNPYRDSIPPISRQDDSLSADVEAGLRAKYEAVYNEYRTDFPSAPTPYTDPYVVRDLTDNGQDDQLVPLKDRR